METVLLLHSIKKRLCSRLEGENYIYIFCFVNFAKQRTLGPLKVNLRDER